MPDDARASEPVAVLDHVAVGARTLADGWALFGGLLGGTWVYGGNSPGFWWGQLQFAAGPKIELLTPTGGPDAAFLERFLAGRGPGFHHLNFIVPDIATALGKLAELGVEPVRVRVQNPAWKEAFLGPRDGCGTVVQVAEQGGPPPSASPPADLGEPGRACALGVIEQRVADLEGATRLFRDALDGQVVGPPDGAGGATELGWRNGARLRLVQSAADGDGTRSGAGIAHLRFSRDEGAFGPADRNRAAALAGRLGVSVRLDSGS